MGSTLPPPPKDDHGPFSLNGPLIGLSPGSRSRLETHLLRNPYYWQRVIENRKEKKKPCQRSRQKKKKTHFSHFPHLMAQQITSPVNNSPTNQAQFQWGGIRPRVRQTSKHTFLANFMDCCARMHREPDHVKNFILGLVKRVGFINDQNMLTIEGRLGPQNFEFMLRMYINEYVRCNQCDGFDTILPMANGGSFILICQQCGSGRCVGDCCKI